jgi:hypothetical protein
MATNLVSVVMQFLTPDMIGRIAAVLGLDRNTAQTAITSAVPALLAGFSGAAAQPGGAQKLFDAATQTGPLEGFARMLGSGNQSSLIESGTQMLSSLLGSRDQNALAGAIGRVAGMGQGSTGSLLGMLAPAVLGTIAQQQGTRLDPSRLAGLLASQKDNIAAAMPPQLSNLLAGTGLLDSLGGAARTATAAGSEAARASASAARSVGDTTRRVAAASAPSYNWLYWLIPAAAIAALLLYLARPVEQVAQQGGTVGLGQSTMVGGLDVNKQVSDSLTSLRTTLAGVTDTAAAQAALPKLREVAAQFDKVNGLSGQLSADQRKALAAQVNPAMPTLNQLFDKVLAVPGTPEELKPTVDALKAKLNALAA